MTPGSKQGQPSTRGATQHPRGLCPVSGHSLLDLATCLGLSSPSVSAKGGGVFFTGPRGHSRW